MGGTPLLTQLFDSFLGHQEGIHAIILPDVFSTGGSLNLWIDKYGRAKRILGYDALNTAITTNGGASAVLGRGLFPYRKTSGGSTTRQTLAIVDDGTNEWELFYSTDDGANWTFVADLGSSSVGKIPDFAQQGDTLIITNGVIAPRKWDGTSLTTAGATQSPTVTSAAGTSGVLTGNFKWKLVSLFSDGSRKAGSVASTVLLLSAERASLSWTADADGTVVGYELYRTTGTGELYYYVTTIDGRLTVAYTDNIEDFTIIENRILEEHGDPPPSGAYFCEPHKGRMWYFRTDSQPQNGWWSDPGNPESVLQTTENTLAFKDAETQGDVITGAKGDFEGLLVVGEERSLWIVSGDGEVVGNIVNWTRSRTNAQTGWVSHRTVAKIPAGSKYTDQNGQIQQTSISSLAYLTPLKDVRLFDGDNDTIISHPVKDRLALLNYEQRRKCWAVQDIERSEIAWCFPSGSDGEPSYSVVWNYKFGVWYPREWGFGHAIEMDTTTDSSIILAISNSVTTGGYVYKLWEGNSFDGVNFQAQWMTKTLYGVNEQGQPAVSHRKRWRWAEILMETETNVTLTVEWMPGDSPDTASATGQDTFAPTGFTLLSNDGDTILTADGDSILSAASSSMARVPLKVDRRYLHHRGIRLRIYDDAQAGSWSLEAFNLAYQILEGLKRRSGALP